MPRNAGNPWTQSADSQLRLLVKNGMTVEQAALLMGRYPSGIKARMERLGLTPAAPTLRGQESLLLVLSAG